MEKDDKLKALDAALSQIEKQYGKGAVMAGRSHSTDERRTIPYRFL